MHHDKDITYARSRAFNYVMEHKNSVVTIMNDKLVTLGEVWYQNQKTGPVYFSERTRKKYLLDYDGEIYDMKTEKRVKTIIRKKPSPFGL
jgi:hypothetical protein